MLNSNFLGLISFCLFLKQMFPQQAKGKVLTGIIIIGLCCGILVTVTPMRIFYRFLGLFHLHLLITWIWFTWVLIKAILQDRNVLAKVLTGGGIILILTVINDILFENGIIQTGYFKTHGLSVFILFQAIVIAIQNQWTHRDKELAQKEAFLDLSQTTFSYERFVPKELLEHLGKDSIIDVQLGDNIAGKMSVLFSDIRSFTTLSESMSPQENFNFLNAYLKRMVPVISEHNGFIDKYIGDAIMATFAKSADDAVQSAIEMLKTLESYNHHRVNSGYAPISIGVGINTGELMLGMIGGYNRMEGTVISDAVNLASRVEGMTKMYGVSILISDQTFHSLQHPEQFKLRVIDQVVVKGKTEPVTVWEVFDGDTDSIRNAKLLTAKLFEEGVTLYYLKKFAEALKLFQECLYQYPEDKAVSIYVNRCQHYLKVGWDDSWDGIERLDSK